ncbi:hypothetical protein HHL17_04010 [Chitinophaga sp. G-6-1-13]|uniref:DUF6438 domain-containing protein n=1 Tax=Chitinophaga fulva TaxID=2728842 RepID=A0A848GHG4_9BACT|nr:DUF6438 domain-containing protein [Chitinophaga fulva]NML36353.1 hypothetical protein [Chitinophaga fulva]
MQKAWVGPELAYVSFDSTRCVFDFFGRFPIDMTYRINGDTLLLQSNGLHLNFRGIGNPQFRIKRLTSDSLVLVPADPGAVKMVRGQPALYYVSQAITATDTIRFDSLYFKSSLCYGECPAMEYQISKNRQLKFIGGSHAVKEGHYTDVLSDSTYKRLQYLLSISALDKLKAWEQRISDVPRYTVAVWYNNKRQVIYNYRLPLVMNQLFKYLLTLPANVPLQKSGHPFVLVNPDTLTRK